jgi:predicted PurR-regulated permease PerM
MSGKGENKMAPEQEATERLVKRYWLFSLALGAVVIQVVAFLLNMLARAAEQIEEAAGEIWRVGKLVANNTVHIPVIARANQSLEQIAESAEGIGRETERILQAVGAANGHGKEQ